MTREEAIKVLLDEWKCIDRNDGINCDRKCESCDLVMDSFVLKDAYNTAIQALSQEPCEECLHNHTSICGNCKHHDEFEQEPTFDDECQKDMDEAWEQIQKKRKRIPVTLDLTPDDDAISRQAVLEKLNEWDWQELYLPIHFKEYIIDELPSVKPKSDNKYRKEAKRWKNKWLKSHKSGKWTLMYEPKNMAVCSECGKCAYMYQDKTSAFCPHCGAYMREPQESEDAE